MHTMLSPRRDMPGSGLTRCELVAPRAPFSVRPTAHVDDSRALAGRLQSRERTRDLDDTERDLLIERARLATSVDHELRTACRAEATARRRVGDIARELLSRRAYQRLGFVRVGDYARERLGVSGRSLQSAAWAATRLGTLPLVAAAFDHAELSWTQVRALCRLATPDDEAWWLARARQCTVAELTEYAAAADADPGNHCTVGEPTGGADGPDPDPEDNLIDGEAAVRFRVACPTRMRPLWRRALELASRVAGEPLATWRAAEFIAADAIAGRPAGSILGDRVLILGMRLARRARRCLAGQRADSTRAPAPAAVAESDPAAGGIGGVSPIRAIDDVLAAPPTQTPIPDPSVAATTEPIPNPPVASTTEPIPNSPVTATTDPFVLDAQLRAAMRGVRAAEPRIGRLLRIVVDHRLYRTLRFTSFDGYVRERLGLSARKAWALLKVERSACRADAFGRAYEDGVLSWVRALTLLPVIDRENADAWIARAQTVTVRRLADEVNTVLDARDLGGPSVRLVPPPLDAVLRSPVVHIGARPRPNVAVTKNDTVGREACLGRAIPDDPERRAAYEVCDAEISFTGPASVVALLRDALDAFAPPGVPRWAALERILNHVVAEWEAMPRHRDPIFERDVWRCAVPACSSRRNLHDHHLVFRSRGGANAQQNRIAVCVAHYNHGIHAAVIRASGTAPRSVLWELGLRSNAPPLLTCLGDRYVGDRCVGNPSVGDRYVGDRSVGDACAGDPCAGDDPDASTPNVARSTL